MSSFNMDEFVYADDDDVEKAIEEEPVSKYTEVDDEETNEAESEDEDEEYDEEDESDNEEGEEEEDLENAEEEEESEDGPPAKTGDKAEDGRAHAEWKKRERVRQEKARADKLEEELAFIKGQMDALKGQQPQQSKVPEESEDISNWEIDYEDMEKSFDSRYEQLTKRQIAQIRAQEEQEWEQLARLSAYEAKQEYADYDEVESHFIARLKGPDGEKLRLLMRKQPDPAEWAYKNQKRYEKRKTAESPEVIALKKEIEQLKKVSKQQKRKKPSKRSLANARNSGKKSSAKPGPKNDNDAFDDLFSK